MRGIAIDLDEKEIEILKNCLEKNPGFILNFELDKLNMPDDLKLGEYVEICRNPERDIVVAYGEIIGLGLVSQSIIVRARCKLCK